MSEQRQQHIDNGAIMELAQVRATLDQALAAYGTDPQLRRAFIHSIGAIDDRLGQPREWPARKVRRQGR